MLQDAHLHLHDSRVPGLAAEILARAAPAGIGRFFCNASSPADWDAVVSIAGASTAVTPFFGVHPWYVARAKERWHERLEELLAAHPAAGIGEIGLDGTAGRPPLEEQRCFFERQLALARRLARPAAIHCVDAWGMLLEVLRDRRTDVGPFMMHAYSGSRESLVSCIDRGAYVSFSARLVTRAPDKAAALLRAVPSDRLLIETDFPYLPASAEPVERADGYRSALIDAYEAVCRLTGSDRHLLEGRIWENGSRFLAGRR